MTETKATNGLLTDRLNNTRTKNQPIWLTIDASKITNDWWQTLHESFSQYHHGCNDESRSTDQTYNITDWQTPFTWLWRWLPLRLSKRQSPTTVLFKLHSPGRSHYTNYWYSWVQTIYWVTRLVNNNNFLIVSDLVVIAWLSATKPTVSLN